MEWKPLSAALSGLCIVLSTVGCRSGIPWNERVLARTVRFPAPDGVYEVVVEYEDSRGFSGNPNLTWLLLQRLGSQSLEENAIMVVDSRLKFEAHWTSASAVHVRFYGPPNRTVTPILLRPNRSPIQLRIDQIETEGVKKLL
jgi:hypothetical protein